ncbi:MAG: hypothetical protein IJB57_07200 [Clostridia bacterium]|nr:hypothetical protein [Clostridia bacterium]
MYNNVGFAIGMIIFMFLFYGALLAFVVINYILTAKAMYKLSQRRGISCPWMAWIPVLNSWNMGLVANEYDEHLGMKRKWNLLLTILHGATIVGMTLTYTVMFVMILVVNIQGDFSEPALIVGFALVMYSFMLLMIFALMTMQFIAYIVLFKIFESTVPEKAVKYLLLSLLVPLASAICLTKCADKGYPFPEAEPVITE